MRGGKGDGPNPAEEFLYKLSLKRDFQRDLQVFRLAIGIPQSGFSSAEEMRDWVQKDEKAASSLLFAVQLLEKKHQIPWAYMAGMYGYLLFGDASFVAPKASLSAAEIMLPAHLVNLADGDAELSLRHRKEPYARLLILGTSTKTEVLRFIEKNWNQVEEILKLQGWKPRKRVRVTKNKERNILIKQLWRQPTKALQEEAESESAFKELLIQHILKKRGFGDVNEGYIRKLCSNK